MTIPIALISFATTLVSFAQGQTQDVRVTSMPADDVAIVSAVINGILALAAAITLRLVWVQSAAATKAADAAEKTVNAYKDRERAWVLANPAPWNPNADYAGPDEVNIFKAVSLSIYNAGSTPAKIKSISTRFIALSSLDDLPIEPHYKDSTPFKSLLISPHDSVPFWAELESEDIPMASLLTGEKFLYIQTRVMYEDIYDKAHETNTGRIWDFTNFGKAGRDKPAIRPAGPASYNVCT